MANHDYGSVIECGAADWQIFQQDQNGIASITLRGRWVLQPDQKARSVAVFVRIVREDGYAAVSAALDWQRATTRKDGSWSIKLAGVPAGGLYRIETCLQLDRGPIEWACRGDMVHHIGVGDIWVITGQSNAAGYGKTPVEDGPELGIHMFAADGKWKLATHPLGDSTATRYSPNRENANASHSPWLIFARKLRKALGYPIGLIPAALGGSPISMWDRKVDGRLFTNMLRYIADCGSTVRGTVWYQGESDTGDEARAVYAERFRNVVRDLRREMKNNRLPVITVQLNRYVGEALTTPVHRNWEQMRELQRQLSREMDGVEIVSVFDATLSDGIHNDSGGNMLVGARCATAALGACYGHAIAWKHPECRSATRLSATRVELTFDNVVGRLHYENRVGREFPFAVRDMDGDVPVADYALHGRQCLRLTLGRPLVGQATVTGAPTADPSTNVPFDIPGYRPMLGFTRVIRDRASVRK